ncbi:glutamate receptor ionotropic, kainate 2-like isoform X2 [Oscarella lobularis]|uniref:glutamate receptor ionotropic, kainate 2-like isoform X2 n=1 Tax=Oscarella lobularis TaxID=121494 RepID=UPI0033143B27
MTVFAATLLLFPLLLSSQSPGLALKSTPVIHIVTDYDDSVFLSHLDSILKRIESSFPVLIQTTRRSHEDCSVPNDSALSLHFTTTCLPFGYTSLPVLSFASGERRRLVGMGNLGEGQIRVAFAFAIHSRWQKVELWTDDDDVVPLFLRLTSDSSSGSTIRHLGALNEKIRSPSNIHNAEAIIVHCLSSSCFKTFQMMWSAWSDTNVKWIYTEDVTRFLYLQVAKKHPVYAFGLERVFPQHDWFTQQNNISDACGRLLSRCPAGLTQWTATTQADVYDSILFLNRLADYRTSELSTHMIRKIAKELSPLAAGGPIELNNDLRGRLYTNYNVIDLADPFLSTVGVREEKGFSSTKERSKRAASEFPNCTAVKGPPYHFRIGTIEEPPFLFYDKNDGGFEGLIVDLLDKLGEIMDFTYELVDSSDGKYGTFTEYADGSPTTANGLVSDVANCRVDIGAAAMAITADREKYIDFTKPWMDYGLTLLGPKPHPVDPSLLSFSDPFTPETWLAILALLLVMTVLLPILQYVAPKELQNEDQETRVLPSFVDKLYNSFWFFFTTAMQQGPDGAFFLPGKLLYGAWYFFILIIVSSYTANLAAFLTLQNIPTTINSVDDLASQTEILYGTVKDSAVEAFFVASDVDVYHKMSKHMQIERDRAMVENSSYGIDRARDWETFGDYVFIWDSPVLEYFAGLQPCTARIIGRTFYKKGYGIAMPKGMPYHDDFTLEILKLRENGWIAKESVKWLTTTDCPNSVVISETDSITVRQLAGVFVISGAFICVAILAAILQRCIVGYKVFSLKEAEGESKDGILHKPSHSEDDAADQITSV